LIAVAVRAAGSVSGERERRTLDSLLSTPLDDREILWGKWWASILSVRKAWWCLGGIWGLGVFSCSLSPFAVPLLVAAWFVYAALAAGLGIWFSLTCRTTLRATVWTLITIVGVGAGPWIMDVCCRPFLLSGPAVAHGYGPLLELDLYAMTPLWTLNFLAFYGGTSSKVWVHFGAVELGLLFYATAAFFLWLWLNARFGQLTGRMSSRVSGP